MVPWKLLKYTALAVGLFVVASLVLSAIATLVGIVWSILVGVVALAAIVALGYAGYRGYRWLSSDASDASVSNRDASGSAVETGSTDPVDRLQTQYTEGRISEAEFERRLGEELGDSGDEIDRELERERT